MYLLIKNDVVFLKGINYFECERMFFSDLDLVLVRVGKCVGYFRISLYVLKV